MGSCNMTAGMEMPAMSTADTKGIPTGSVIKAGKDPMKTIMSDFKKKLEAVTMGATGVTAQETASVPVQDNSMATESAAQESPQEIAGILEGFGLLDYQMDQSAATAEATPTGDGDAQASATATGTQQAQISDQFARMLTNEQQSELPQNVLPQTNADAGKYSGSLESTNSQAVAAEAAMPVDADEAAMQLKSKMLPNAVAQDQQMTIPQQSQQGQPIMPQQAGQAAMNQQAGQGQTPQQQAQTESVSTAAQQAGQAEAGLTQDVQPASGNKTETAEPTVADAPNVVNTGTEAVATSAGKVQYTDKAAEAATSSNTTNSVFVKDNVIQIVDKVQTGVHQGRYEFDVDLKPDFLGKVSIKLTMESGEIRMHVKVDDPTVKGMFSDQTSALQTALKEKGITVTAVDVSYQDPMATGQETFTQSGNGNGQKREGQIGWNTDRYSGGDLFDTTAPVSELLGGSSVEYLA